MNQSFLLRLPLTLLALCCALTLPAQESPGRRPNRPAPDTPPPVPAGIKAHRDLAYVTHAHARQKLDLYVPENVTAPLPLIVWIHGGGWASGSKNGCPPLRGGFAARGYAVASLDYRLSGDAIFPAAVEDCKAALRWLRAHAKDYNLDPNRIGVWGSSAGGHLVAFLGTSGDTRNFDVGENLDQSSAVQAAVDYYGPTDFIQMDAHALPGTRLIHDSPTSPESRFIGGPIQDPANRALVQRANPIIYATPNDPPTLIVHGDQDPAVPHHQSELLHATLVQAGVPVRFITIKGGGHGQGFPGAELDPLVSEFSDRHLRGNQAVANWPKAMTSSLNATATGGTPDAPVSARARPAAPTPAESTPSAASVTIQWQPGSVTAPDGTKVALLRATPAGPGPFPVVIFFHGAPGGIGEEGLRRFAGSSRWNRFLEAGFAVCVGDYRGHPDGQPFNVLRGDINATDDVAAIVKFLGTRPELDLKRLAIMGGSLGGVTTLQAVSSGKVSPRCMVLNAPASFPFIGLRGQRERGAPVTEANIDKAGAMERIKPVNCPVLIVQGTGDALTPVNRMLHTLLLEAGKDAKLELFENESHSFTNGPDTEAYRRALELSLKFIQQHTSRPPARPSQAQRPTAPLPADRKTGHP